MMNSKKLLVILSETPTAQDPEGDSFKTALGITAGYKEHFLNVLLTADAVFSIRMQDGHNNISKYLKAFKFMKIDLYLDEKALSERKIDHTLIKEPFKIAGREEILNLYKNSDLTISL